MTLQGGACLIQNFWVQMIRMEVTKSVRIATTQNEICVFGGVLNGSINPRLPHKPSGRENKQSGGCSLTTLALFPLECQRQHVKERAQRRVCQFPTRFCQMLHKGTNGSDEIM